jgi:hypothetical protein
MLPLRFAFISHNVTSPNLFDIPSNNNEILYLASVDGNLRILDLLKIKTNSKVQILSVDDTVQQVNVLQNQELNNLVCLSDDIIAISTEKKLYFFDRKDFSKILQTINLHESIFDRNMFIEDDNNRLLISNDYGQQFITIYRQEKNCSSILNQMKIQFRSNVEYIKLIQTTTLIDNDDKKKSYVLILLDDETIQLLDTNQLSQASLQPTGLFTRIKYYNVLILNFQFHILRCFLCLD